MDIWSKDKLLLFITFVIPGFVSLKVYELLNPDFHKDSSKLLIDAIAFSCINYALLLWPIAYVESSGLTFRSPSLYALFYMGVLFVAPIVWALIWAWIRKSWVIRRYARHPTLKPWDFLFGQGKHYWIIVTLNGGRKVGGLFGDKSFASGEPASEQLFLEQHWILDSKGLLERPVDSTAGILITAHEILCVELFERER